MNKQQNTMQAAQGPDSDGVRMFNKPIVINSVDAYLDDDIQDGSYYRELLHYMRNMEEGDELRLWIDTDGGILDGATAIIDAMKTCQGDITCIVTGKAYSAGSLIALSAPNLLIGESATFMCHSHSYGLKGKHSDIESNFAFHKRVIEKMLRDGYKWFLTDAEIEQMLQGKDFWFDTEETKARLENRLSAQQAAQKKAQQLTKPKRKTKVVTDKEQ